MKKFLIIITVILLLFISTQDTFAYEASRTSASLNSAIALKNEDNRIAILREYLEEKNSPLAPYAQDFVENADKYNLDWRLVASIAGLESSFGKHIPYNSYNGWGWGIYGDNVKRFNSWDEGIGTISKGIHEGYLAEGQYSDPYLIGPKYAASPTWAVRVTYFMNQIEDYRVKKSKTTLSLAL